MRTNVVFINIALIGTLSGSIALTPEEECGHINLTGAGIAGASSSASGGPLGTDFSAAKAFDHGGQGGVEGFTSSNGHFDYTTIFYAERDRLPVVLKYDFQQPTTVCGYAIVSVPWVEKAMTDSPLGWTFEGSNDGENWEILHRIDDQTEWGPLEMRRFSLTHPVSFTRYRLRITHVHGRVQGERFVGVAEIEIYGLVSPDMQQEAAQAAANEQELLGSQMMQEGSGPDSIVEHFDNSAQGELAHDQGIPIGGTAVVGASAVESPSAETSGQQQQSAPGNQEWHQPTSGSSSRSSSGSQDWGQQQESAPGNQEWHPPTSGSSASSSSGSQGWGQQQQSAPGNQERGQPTSDRPTSGRPTSDSIPGSAASSTANGNSASAEHLQEHPQTFWDETKEDAAVVGDDVEKAGEDMLLDAETADGHIAEVILLVGLALFVIGFVVIRHRQSKEEADREQIPTFEVQRPPDGTFSNYLSRPQEDNAYSKVRGAGTTFSAIGHHGEL